MPDNNTLLEVGAERECELARQLGEISEALGMSDAEVFDGGHAAMVARIRELIRTLTQLCFMARTSGGTAGPDSALMKACEGAEAVIARATSGAA